MYPFGTRHLLHVTPLKRGEDVDGSENPNGGWFDKGHAGKPAGKAQDIGWGCGLNPETIRSTGNPQRPYASPLLNRFEEDEMVRSLRRRKEVGRNDRPASSLRRGHK